MEFRSGINIACGVFLLMVACGGSSTVNAMEAEAQEPLVDNALHLREFVVRCVDVYDERLVKLLAEIDQDKAIIDARGEYGMTALHLAALSGYESLCLLLVQNGADVNAVDEKGNTPLHLAAEALHIDAIQVLAGIKGIDLNVANKKGQNLLDVLIESAKLRFSELIEQGAHLADADKVKAQSEEYLWKKFVAATCKQAKAQQKDTAAGQGSSDCSTELEEDLFKSAFFVPTQEEEAAIQAAAAAGIFYGASGDLAPIPDGSSGDSAAVNAAQNGAPEGFPVDGSHGKKGTHKPQVKSSWSTWLKGSIVGAVIVGGVAYAAKAAVENIEDIKKFLIDLKGSAEQKLALEKKQTSRA